MRKTQKRKGWSKIVEMFGEFGTENAEWSWWINEADGFQEVYSEEGHKEEKKIFWWIFEDSIRFENGRLKEEIVKVMVNVGQLN